MNEDEQVDTRREVPRRRAHLTTVFPWGPRWDHEGWPVVQEATPPSLPPVTVRITTVPRVAEGLDSGPVSLASELTFDEPTLVSPRLQSRSLETETATKIAPKSDATHETTTPGAASPVMVRAPGPSRAPIALLAFALGVVLTVVSAPLFMAMPLVYAAFLDGCARARSATVTLGASTPSPHAAAAPEPERATTILRAHADPFTRTKEATPEAVAAPPPHAAPRKKAPPPPLSALLDLALAGD